MYDSNISVKDYLDSVAEEADISVEIPRTSLLRWLTTVEQFAYTEVLKEYVRSTIVLESNPTDIVRLDLLPVPDGAAIPEYDDIVRVYDEGGNEIRKSGADGAYEFTDYDLFYTDYEGHLCLSTRTEQSRVTVIYRIRPVYKTSDNQESLNVALPVEYLDMAGAKIRGEAYKIANEDGLSAKWLADYNTQIENFKIWAASRNERYGI